MKALRLIWMGWLFQFKQMRRSSFDSFLAILWPLFFGRAVPVVLNGAFVSAFSLLMGSLILDIEIPADAIPALALVILVAAFSCTGLGLINAALALRIRESAVLSNVFFGFLLIFTGANVPLSDLPGWMRAVSDYIPFTHSIAAARKLVDGSSTSSVMSLVGAEVLIGVAYAVAGYLVFRFFENQGRRHATLERT